MCSIILLQASEDSNTPPNPCAPPGLVHLHEHYCNLGIPKLTTCLHASIQATPCYLGLNNLLWNAKYSSNARNPLNKANNIYMVITKNVPKLPEDL
jgi:hypothetical protein